MAWSRVLISSDDFTGVDTYHNYDSDTDTSVFEYQGDAWAQVEFNKTISNERDFTRKGIKQEWWLYASIPPIVQLKWLTEDGIDVMNPDHGPRVSKKLEDPEWRYLKCTSGKHIIKAHD